VEYLVVAFYGGHRDVVVLGHPLFIEMEKVVLKKKNGNEAH